MAMTCTYHFGGSLQPVPAATSFELPRWILFSKFPPLAVSAIRTNPQIPTRKENCIGTSMHMAATRFPAAAPGQNVSSSEQCPLFL